MYFPAFPKTNTTHEGMMLRDYFAAKAMQAILMDKSFSDACEIAGKQQSISKGHSIARAAYGMANAMMDERELNA